MRNQVRKIYRDDLDLLKGFAILAVVLYHLGISRSGYLGVDAFFVINGFLIVPSVMRDVREGRFRYFAFLEKRMVRLLPLVLLVSALSLAVGYWGMLPDDYENLGESVVASSFFSNNILASLTTKNYWDVSNDYKALMHTWYIGVLFEFYLIFPLIVLFVKRLSKEFHFSFFKYVVITLISLSVVSLLAYLDPLVSAGDRFYLIPYRFFELTFGGLAGIWVTIERKGRLCKNGLLSVVGLLLFLFVMFVGVIDIHTYIHTYSEYNLVTGVLERTEWLIPQNILLLLTIVLTVLFVVSDNMQSRLFSCLVNMKVLCLLGMMSYSIFMWHQPLLAFYRYFISRELTPFFILYFAVLLTSLSFVTYRFVEQRLQVGRHVRILTIIAFLLVNGLALTLYMHAGVVRDVPELYVQMNNVHRNMHAEYVDRVYSYNKDFPKENGKINVLVIGNSFARDWGNILLESDIVEKINLSYVNEISEKYVDRIKQADYVFVHDWKHKIPHYFWESVRSDTEVWGVGTKNFGECNGIIYKNRRRSDYFQQTVKINPIYQILNKQLKKEWKDNYVDLLGLSLISDARVLVFSHDRKFISQDTRHLTKGGAEFFANKIDWNKIFQDRVSN